jgi:amidophosphoribosyltransferase
MSGIFGVVSKDDCVDDLFLGTHYLQHRAQDYCGLALYDDKTLRLHTHKGTIRQQFHEEKLNKLKGYMGIGSVTSERQPVSELAKRGGMVLAYDGNIINYHALKDGLLLEGTSFSGYKSPEEVSGAVLISKIISQEPDFVSGVKKLASLIRGDFSLLVLTNQGIHIARGWGRKPLILGKKNASYAVASESNSFPNLGFEIVRDVEPGEVILLDREGIHVLDKLNIEPVKYGTFEWVYTSHPVSIVDGRSVAEVRKRIGNLLAEKYPVDADIVAPVPNSGRWHAAGFAETSGIPYLEVFVRYDYSDRSYTPQNQRIRDREAKTKLIPIKNMIKGKRIVLVDDSIVRGTQMLNRVEVLKELGAKEVHVRIACPPLLAACKYGQTTKKDEDCIARRMSVEEIRKKLHLDSLEYATFEILEKAIGLPKEKLCLECWKCNNCGFS